ncbi:hypothetical protein BJV74DRAFT_889948 [Russula compacta]|nr:hypothetical protein BJV74DRAFT_889948 [Russula compacta]
MFPPQPTLDPRSSSFLLAGLYETILRLEELRSLFVRKLVLNDGSQESDAVVKFTSSYHEEAHKLRAENYSAPKLYACHRAIGNLFMLVMERIKGKNMKAHKLTKEPLKATVFDDTTESVKLHQEHDFVHRDLRTVNTMIDPEVKAKLIDFNWAGKSCTVALIA